MPATYNSHHDPQITEPHLHLNIIETPILINFSCAANWYSRLPPGCIYSWQQLKEKFLLNFQGFQAELDMKEGFLSCAQRRKETLPNFYRMFLQLKAHAPKVSDDQVIARAIKALRAGPLHRHLVREQPKIVLKLYEQFLKFSMLEIYYLCKLEQ
jgi:hypothetical protein